MICRKCGELLSDGARVCPVCGARQRTAGGTKLNPGHTDAEDCAHEEAHRPRKRRGIDLRWFAPLILPLLVILTSVVSAPLGLDSNKVLTGAVEVLFLVSFIGFIIISRRNKK